MFLNFYAAIGIIIALDLTAWQITIIAVILSCIIEDTLIFAALGPTGGF